MNEEAVDELFSSSDVFAGVNFGPVEKVAKCFAGGNVGASDKVALKDFPTALEPTSPLSPRYEIKY